MQLNGSRKCVQCGEGKTSQAMHRIAEDIGLENKAVVLLLVFVLVEVGEF